MVLEIAATAFLTVAFEKLFERLASREFAYFFRGKKSVDDQLKTVSLLLDDEQLKGLKTKLKTVSLLLDDAEDRQVGESRVKEWLEDLKDVVFKLDDLFEEIAEEARIKIDQSGSRSIGVMTEFDKTVEAEVKKFSGELDILMITAGFLNLKYVSPQATRSSIQRSPAPLKDERYVYGRNGDKENILKLLLCSDDDEKCVWRNRIGVLPIVGMGGLGKTTLAQLVYDDERVKEHKFEPRAWVTVSTEFDVFKIIKSLMNQIEVTSPSDEPAILQRAMKEALRGKKFLFVLDDVWDEKYHNWNLLMSIFADADSRSKIVVTTRSSKVCSIVKGPIHKLELVSEDDCWKIFVQHAFDGDLNVDEELKEIGRSIVAKCKGLPLAVQAVGGLLRGMERNPKKWETILKSPAWKWSDSQGSGVLPSLWLSYQYLPSPLKQCFAYCAVFPQDYEFEKKDIVLLWMAEGFLQLDSHEKCLEEVGDEYFEFLISRSFLQFKRKYEVILRAEVRSLYVMHDLVHDLATFVSGQFCLRCSHCTSSKARYLYCNAKVESDSMKSFGEATCLHTYIDERRYILRTDSSVEEIVGAGRFLRVLRVRGKSISELLSSSKIHLKHLRYLNLSDSDIEEVPDSVCSLYSLQTLDLTNCHRLSKLPTNMGNLINLRHLDFSYQIKKMPPRMGNLKELRTLSDFCLGKADDDDDDDACSSIKELGELPHLSGELHVRGLQNVETADDARKANLREKSNLVALVLQWEGESSDTRREWEVLGALRPPTNLEQLRIEGYAAPSFPNWVGDSSFSKMVSLTLRGSGSDINLCSSLPPLGQLVSLKELEIRSFYSVVSIGSEFYGNNSSTIPFPRLESLTFAYLKSLKEWSFVGRDGSDSIGCFPRLNKLSLIWCPNLESVFFDCEVLLSLNSLEIWSCNKLVEQNRHWNLQRLTSLTSLSIDNLKTLNGSAFQQQANNDLDSFPQGLLPTSLTSLTLKFLDNLKTLNGSAFQQLKSLQILDISHCKELESLPEQVLSTSLSHLYIHHCPLLETRYQKEKGDGWPCISHIPNMSMWGPTIFLLEQEERERAQRETNV